MKKFLLLATAAAFAASAYATDYVNHVKNGDFEAAGWEQAVPEAWNWAPCNTWAELSVLPEWTISTAGIWNGVVSMIDGDDAIGDGDIRPETDLVYVHYRGYNDNGWTNISLSQAITDLVPGREYTLEYICMYQNSVGSRWTPDPKFGYSVSELDFTNEGAAKAGKEIVSANLGANLDENGINNSDWETVSVKFNAPADGKIFLDIWLYNGFGDDNNKQTSSLWMDVDLVKVYSEEEEQEGVADAVLNLNAPVEYFNLQGVRVANPENGLYIRRQGNKAVKVAL